MWQAFVPASEGGGGGRKKRNRSDVVTSGAGEAASAIYEEVIRPRGRCKSDRPRRCGRFVHGCTLVQQLSSIASGFSNLSLLPCPVLHELVTESFNPSVVFSPSIRELGESSMLYINLALPAGTYYCSSKALRVSDRRALANTSIDGTTH